MFKKITVVSKKKANGPGWLRFFITLSLAFFRQHVVIWKEKQSWWFLIVSASYTIDPPETISNWTIFKMRLQRFAMSL